jgi:signal peptidase I
MRIVGLPGETLQIVGGLPVIDGSPVNHEEIGAYPDAGVGGNATIIRETLPDSRSYNVVSLEAGTLADDTQAFAIPSGSYFVMGDNRDNSNDSRFALGFVPIDNIVGRIDTIFANTEGKSYKERSNSLKAEARVP